jgi:ribosomal protein S18 acetylase RimI-like enzyme
MIINEFDIDCLDSIRYLQPAGWSDITVFFEFYYKQDFCRPVMVLDGGQVVGVGNATLNGKSGWLAHIIVAEDYRGMGIGSLLTGHLIDYMHDGGCRTILLIATESGERIYRKFGFETVGEYLLFSEMSVGRDAEDASIREYRSGDYDALLRLDHDISGESRGDMISQFLSNALVYSADSSIEGFFLPGFDEEMIMAKSDRAGLALLEHKHNGRKCKTVVPRENEAAIGFLKSNGSEILSRIPRMMLGESIPWRPDRIFSRAGGFYG